MVDQLDGPPDRDYSERDDRKYMNDTGGPSVWWRDGIMQEIRDSISSATVETQVFDELDELLSESSVEDDYLIRLESFISDRPAQRYGNADEMLEAFAGQEDKRHRLSSALRFLRESSWTVFVALLTFWTVWDWTLRAILLGLLVVSGSVAARTFSSTPKQFLTTDELKRLQRVRDRSG
jgi:hypothetical protein